MRRRKTPAQCGERPALNHYASGRGLRPCRAHPRGALSPIGRPFRAPVFTRWKCGGRGRSSPGAKSKGRSTSNECPTIIRPAEDASTGMAVEGGAWNGTKGFLRKQRAVEPRYRTDRLSVRIDKELNGAMAGRKSFWEWRGSHF